MEITDYSIEEFITDLATDPNVPNYVQSQAKAFIEEMEAKDAKRIKNRLNKVAKSVDSKIPRVKVYMPKSNEA